MRSILGCAAFLLLMAVPTAGVVAIAQGSEALQYYLLEPGTPTADGDVFQVPIFMLGEPAGSPANASEVRQAWEDLSLLYLNDSPGPFSNWSVPSWGPGRFDLRLVFVSSEIAAIDSGQALLALNSSVVVGSTVYGAAGTVDGAVLSSSIVEGSWWASWFGIPNPPPSTNPASLSAVLADLAWFGDSTAGRALYASTALLAALLYLLQAHRIAKERVFGTDAPRRGGG